MIHNDHVMFRLRPHKAILRKLNRVGSHAPEIATSEIKTIGQRMTLRRIALKLTQAHIANEVQFVQKTGRRKGAARPLSRNAYAMYEIGQSEPDLKKIEAIARALGVTPSWLAFG